MTRKRLLQKVVAVPGLDGADDKFADDRDGYGPGADDGPGSPPGDGAGPSGAPGAGPTAPVETGKQILRKQRPQEP